VRSSSSTLAGAPAIREPSVSSSISRTGALLSADAAEAAHAAHTKTLAITARQTALETIIFHLP
jgi:hypothetical protein